MDVKGVFTQNWPYKVAAIALSLLLWLSVSADTEIAEQAVPTLLELQVSDSAWSLREVLPAEITTTFRGGRNQVFAARFEETIIRKVIDQVEDSVVQIPLSASEVIYNRELGVEPMTVSPSVVTVRLEERVGKRVAVTGRTDARAAPGAFVVGMRLAPDSVWLQGPASFVNQISQVSTELLEVGAVSRDVSQQLEIALPPDLAGLSVDPVTVLGTVDVDSLRIRRFEAEVAATGALAAMASLEPPTVTVTVTGPAAVVDGLDPADLTVTVEIPDAFDGAASYPVRAVLPDDVTETVTIDLDPERVRAAPASARPDPSTP
ncbi:CdaR family protein [Candidatus Palauibacter sp.]|uniref:CdaR family protein n=1 Tax=Candidatus Palauibacter sp. TaxID=3101350 RepID=UPI003AF1FB18